MATGSRINIISKLPPEFSSNIIVDNVTYHAQTEDMGTKSCKIISRIFLKGEVVFSKKSDYSHLTKLKDFSSKLQNLMENQHKSAIDNFISGQSRKQKLKSEYFDEVQQLLRRGNGKSALNTLKHALEKFPSDPFLLSYYGCLVAIVENNPKEGVRICEDAIAGLNNSMPFGSEFFYPVFYLNLGRAYLKNNKKREALNAFKEGLKNDPDNHDILWELKKLGTRRSLAVPFFKRSNPINKYIGLLLSRSLK
ncbi:MAG: tetratricopeptide repeat protein [Nitrospirota bacterium]